MCLQGTEALAVPLVTNTSILRLNLRDNWMEGMGGAAIAEMLKENCYITGGFTWHSGTVSPPSPSICLLQQKCDPHSHSYATLTPIICHGTPFNIWGPCLIFVKCQSYVQIRNLWGDLWRVTPVSHAGSLGCWRYF